MLFVQSKFKQSVEVYYGLLKLQNKDKDSSLLTEKLGQLLSDPNIKEVFYQQKKTGYLIHRMLKSNYFKV